jgi:hypothetical protein
MCVEFGAQYLNIGQVFPPQMPKSLANEDVLYDTLPQGRVMRMGVSFDNRERSERRDVIGRGQTNTSFVGNGEWASLRTI